MVGIECCAVKRFNFWEKKFMNKKNFEGLIKGIREAKKIMRGEVELSRMFVFSPEEIKKIREAVPHSKVLK